MVEGRGGTAAATKTSMKMLMIAGTVALVAIFGGQVLQRAPVYTPADPSERVRQRADVIMTDAYGENWSELLTLTNTNKTQLKAMMELYKSATGYSSAATQAIEIRPP